MARDGDESIVAPGWAQFLQRVRARTPARILEGRAGAAYRTGTQLELREAHAAARDAVREEFENPVASFGASFVERWGLFEVRSQAANKDEFLLRPERGRNFNESSRAELQMRCHFGADLQIAIGDGLSVPAIVVQVPLLLPLLVEGCEARGWKVGQTFLTRHCRVGMLNDIGELLRPKVAVLLIGERPGLATAESLSAYMAYRPSRSQTDADRNLISNIHARGARPQDAAKRILDLAEMMMSVRGSGYRVREGQSTGLGSEKRRW